MIVRQKTILPNDLSRIGMIRPPNPSNFTSIFPNFMIFFAHPAAPQGALLSLHARLRVCQAPGIPSSLEGRC
jgi:hypothetical protein